MLFFDESLSVLARAALALVIVGFLPVQPKQAGEEFSVTIPIDRPGSRYPGKAACGNCSLSHSGDLLQTSHPTEAEHGPRPPSERQM